LITPDRSIQKAILLVGEGGNGKGVFLAGCIAFVGRENVSTVPLHKLESDRFSVARLYGRLVNCCADLPSGDLESTSMFKALTGGDIITGERKYENSFDFQPYARLLFSANHPPRSADASKAFFDRWVVVPFDRSFRGTERERPRREIDAALAAPQELSGVLNKALPALQLLRARGRFSETDSTGRAMAEMQQVTDPLAVWLDREVVTHPNASVTCGSLLVAYNDECARSGRPAVSQTAFGLAIRRLRPSVDVKRRGPKGEQKDYYIGIGFKAESVDSQERA
jgi:putative DNA primase/helicase